METKYFEIVRYFEEEEAAGRLKPGDRLPGERQICRIFRVARGTARAAYGEMLRRGLVVQIHGSGTYWKECSGNRETLWEQEIEEYYASMKFLCFSDEEIMDLAQKEAKRQGLFAFSGKSGIDLFEKGN